MSELKHIACFSLRMLLFKLLCEIRPLNTFTSDRLKHIVTRHWSALSDMKTLESDAFFKRGGIITSIKGSISLG
jgi:hypothetical protein